jgi:gentisate 1,2-dioxygenase
MKITSPHAVERRVLTLANPANPGEDATLSTLCVAYQTLLPHEKARPHRHSMNAIRLVLEGEGAATYVDGKACPMHYGDLILTPGWCWHEHRHDGSDAVVWLDALDVPLHEFLGTTEFQPGPIDNAPSTLPDASFAVVGIVPAQAQSASHSPLFRYPFVEAMRALAAAPAGPDGCQRVRYVNPLNGQSAVQVLECELLRPHCDALQTEATTNANQVFCALQGSGVTKIGDRLIEWSARDVFTAPPGNAVSHQSCTQDSALFCLSDRSLLRTLGLLKDLST